MGRYNKPDAKGTPEQRAKNAARAREWYAKNREVHRERVRRTNYHAKWRDEMLDAYGAICACCGETTRRFLVLDHTNGGGTAERNGGVQLQSLMLRLKREAWPKENHRLLCANCHLAVTYGPCPHTVRTDS